MEHGQAFDKTYDIFSDRAELSSVMTEVGKKGLVPADYQLVLLNFILFWYFLVQFTI